MRAVGAASTPGLHCFFFGVIFCVVVGYLGDGVYLAAGKAYGDYAELVAFG